MDSCCAKKPRFTCTVGTLGKVDLRRLPGAADVNRRSRLEIAWPSGDDR